MPRHTYTDPLKTFSMHLGFLVHTQIQLFVRKTDLLKNSFQGVWQADRGNTSEWIWLILCNGRCGQNSAGANPANRRFYMWAHKCTVTLPLLVKNKGHCYIIQHAHNCCQLCWFWTRPDCEITNPAMAKMGRTYCWFGISWQHFNCIFAYTSVKVDQDFI